MLCICNILKALPFSTKETDEMILFPAAAVAVNTLFQFSVLDILLHVLSHKNTCIAM